MVMLWSCYGLGMPWAWYRVDMLYICLATGGTGGPCVGWIYMPYMCRAAIDMPYMCRAAIDML